MAENKICSQHISTVLSIEEVRKVEDTCKKLNISRYKLFKTAINVFCNGALNNKENSVEPHEESASKEKDTSPNNQKEAANGISPLEEYFRDFLND